MVDSRIVRTGEGDLSREVAGREFHQSRTMATVLGGLFLAGATIGALSLILPHPSEYDSPALWTNVVIAYVAGVVLLLLRARLPRWSLPVILLAGIAVVTRAVYYGHDPSGYYTIWYLWIGVYAFFFFGLRWGLIQMAAVGAAYGWVLAELEGPTPVARWVVTIGSILVAGLLVDQLAGRLRRETDASARRAANLEAVGEVARQLATQSDPRAVGWAICSAAVRTAHASAAVLWRPNPAGDALKATAVAGVDANGRSRAGSMMTTSVPAPFFERISSTPPCSSTSALAIGSPRPAPSRQRERPPSTWPNGVIAISISSAVMPTPLSRIMTTTPLLFVRSASTEIVPPSDVNLTAFEMMLENICRSFWGSPRMAGRS